MKIKSRIALQGCPTIEIRRNTLKTVFNYTYVYILLQITAESS